MINKIIAEEKIQQVRKLLEKKEKIVITCHVSPDGDAIGASLGLYHFLDGLGKEVNVVVPDLLPRNLLFLKGTKEIVVYTRYPEFAEKLMSEAELIFCLDFNAISRIDRLQKSVSLSEAKKVLIIAELVKLGINKDKIYALVYNTNSVDKIKLNGYAVSEKMEVFPEYKAAMISLTREELKRYDYHKGDSEGLVNVPLGIEGIRFSTFFREDKEYIKVSMRSKGFFPVNKVAAEHFNGGGHLNAAGGEFHGTMEEAQALLRSILPLYDKYMVKDKD